jgi:hypothetical protein
MNSTVMACTDCSFERKNNANLTCVKCDEVTCCDLRYEQSGAHHCKDGLLKFGYAHGSSKIMYFKDHLLQKQEQQSSYFCDKCIDFLIKSESVVHSVDKCFECARYAFDLTAPVILYNGGHIINGQIRFGYGSCHDSSVYDLLNKNKYLNETFICDTCINKFIEQNTTFKRHICHLCKNEDHECGETFILDGRYANLSIIKRIDDELYVVDPSRYSMELDADWKSIDKIYLKLKDEIMEEHTEICFECICQLIKDNRMEQADCEQCGKNNLHFYNKNVRIYDQLTYADSCDKKNALNTCSSYRLVLSDGTDKYPSTIICEKCKPAIKSIDCLDCKQYNNTLYICKKCKVLHELQNCQDCKKYVHLDYLESSTIKSIILCDFCIESIRYFY